VVRSYPREMTKVFFSSKKKDRKEIQKKKRSKEKEGNEKVSTYQIRRGWTNLSVQTMAELSNAKPLKKELRYWRDGLQRHTGLSLQG